MTTGMGKVTKVLVANRGEIAVRVLRACRELGLATVAVHSDVDAGALHVAEADQAVFLGAAAPQASYLNIPAIVEAARATGADAVHPGYGFLAENPDFSRACRDAGLTFVGPSPEAIALLGNKVASRELAVANDVPVTPGTEREDLDDEALAAEAERIGFPVLVKAAAGGGGKGMRAVHDPAELPAVLESARRVAGAAFGNSAVYLEKLVERPRHIEFQVVADTHGNVVHCFERECSIQRRHQKVVEETPSTALTDELRRRMGEAAVRLTRAADYVNAGTVEFLLAQEGRFYFLEMNTRIQVEHPVTELVVGVDLVQEQLRIARGEALSFGQDELRQQGHAIEARIYAENPASNFLPSPAVIELLVEPSGPGVRNDCGVRTGDEVTVHYDPILSKLVTWAPTRDGAIARMVRALDDYVILGPSTTVEYLREVVDHQAFRAGETFTDFLGKHFAGWQPKRAGLSDVALVVAGIAEKIQGRRQKRQENDREKTGPAALSSPWTTLGPWEVGSGRGDR